MTSSKDYLKRDDIRGVYPSQLNGETAQAIGAALVRLLNQQGVQQPTICIGHDCRHGGIELSQGLALGITLAGGKFTMLGLVSTEHIYFACTTDQYDAGAMITASHNPKEYNGIKFLYRKCKPFSPNDLAFIGAAADELSAVPSTDFSVYAAALSRFTGLSDLPDSSQTKLRIAVVAGNGMGGVAFAPFIPLLKQKGVETTLLEAEPDGDFPNGVPNPLLPEFMQRVAKAVVDRQADLGIGFDGDADRAGFVDSHGDEIIPSFILSLIGDYKLSKNPQIQHPVIMRNLCCSQFVKKHLESKGCQIIDTPVGHGRIKHLMHSDAYRPRVLFAGEHSGHYFYPEFSFVDSGVTTSLYMISILLQMTQNNVSLRNTLEDWRKTYVWSGEINFTLKSREEAIAAMCRVNEQMGRSCTRLEVKEDPITHTQYVAEENTLSYRPLEMVASDLKLLQDHGTWGWWCVVRLSGNEPKLRLNVEAYGDNAQANCKKITQEIQKLLLS